MLMSMAYENVKSPEIRHLSNIPARNLLPKELQLVEAQVGTQKRLSCKSW